MNNCSEHDIVEIYLKLTAASSKKQNYIKASQYFSGKEKLSEQSLLSAFQCKMRAPRLQNNKNII